MKYVVVAGYYSDDNITEFEQCIGVFDTAREAYGEALLYLTDEIDGQDKEIRDKLSISPLYELEGGTGYEMTLKGIPYHYTDFVTVLFWDDEADHGKHSKEG